MLNSAQLVHIYNTKLNVSYLILTPNNISFIYNIPLL